MQKLLQGNLQNQNYHMIWIEQQLRVPSYEPRLDVNLGQPIQCGEK